MPEWFADAVDQGIRGAGTCAFDIHECFVEGNSWTDQDMHMVGHYDPGVEVVQPPIGGAADQDIADSICRACIFQPQWTSGVAVEDSVKLHERGAGRYVLRLLLSLPLWQ